MKKHIIFYYLKKFLFCVFIPFNALANSDIDSINTEKVKIEKAGIIISFNQDEWVQKTIPGKLQKTPFDLFLKNKRTNTYRTISTSFEDNDFCKKWENQNGYKKFNLTKSQKKLINCAYINNSSSISSILLVKKSIINLPTKNKNTLKRQILIYQNDSNFNSVFNWISNFEDIN